VTVISTQIDSDAVLAPLEFGKRFARNPDNLRKVRSSFKNRSSRFSGLSRGFGFVVMPEMDEAVMAINIIAGQGFHGMKLDVREALTKSRMKNRDVIDALMESGVR